MIVPVCQGSSEAMMKIKVVAPGDDPGRMMGTLAVDVQALLRGCRPSVEVDRDFCLATA